MNTTGVAGEIDRGVREDGGRERERGRGRGRGKVLYWTEGLEEGSGVKRDWWGENKWPNGLWTSSSKKSRFLAGLSFPRLSDFTVATGIFDLCAPALGNICDGSRLRNISDLLPSNILILIIIK